MLYFSLEKKLRTFKKITTNKNKNKTCGCKKQRAPAAIWLML